MPKSLLDQFANDPEELKLFQRDRLVVAVTELICKEMNDRGWKRSALASALKKSKSSISQRLDGEKNLTLHTIADIFTALGLRMKVTAEPISVPSQQPTFIPFNLAPHWEKQRHWIDPLGQEVERDPAELAA